MIGFSGTKVNKRSEKWKEKGEKNAQVSTLNTFSSFFFHHSSPFEIAHDGNNDIEGIEGCLEGDVLIEV